MKRLVCGLAAFAATILAAPAAGFAYSAGIAATVNNDVVTMTDVHNRVQLYLLGAQGRPPADALKKMEAQVLDKLINEKLQTQEAATLGITIDQAQINAGLADIAHQNKAEPEVFKRNLMASGVQIQTLYDQIKAELAWGQVVRRKLVPQINISEGDISTAMDRISRTQGKTQYQVAEIFLNVPAGGDDAAILKKMTDAAAQISSNKAPFSMIARQISQAPGAATGGDLGWIERGTLDAKLDDALGKLVPGQLSAPVRTEKGYHLLLLRDVRTPSGASTATSAPAVAQPAGDMMVHIKQIQIPSDKNDPEAVAKAKIMRAASLQKEIASCDDMTKKMADFNSPGTRDFGMVKLASLDPRIHPFAENMPIGKLSDPIIRDGEGISVIIVCERSGTSTPQAAAPAPIPQAAPQSRTDVVNQLGNQRIERMQQRYLSDLRAAAFIDKRI